MVIVPEFDSNPKLLHRFLTLCEKLVNRFLNVHDFADFQNEFLIHSFAAEHVPNIIIISGNDIKSAHLEAYEDKRDDITFKLNKKINHFLISTIIC